MPTNKGKIFEQQFKISTQKQGIFILRLNDSSLSWQHEKVSKYTVQNPCDFLVFYKGVLFPLELKSSEYNSMSIEKEDGQGAMIKMHQWNSLSNFSTYDGIQAGFLLNFRNKEDSTIEETYWLSIKDFNNFMDISGKQSINKKDVVQYNGILVEQKLKRTHFLYNTQKMLDDIISIKGEN